MELEINPLGLSNDAGIGLETTGVMVAGQIIGLELLKKGIDKSTLIISKQLVKRVQNQVVKSIAETIMKSEGKAIAKQGSEAAVKQLAKTTEELGTEAASDAAVGGATCVATGAETAGIGCVVGAAISAAMFAFDIFNILATIFDKTGISYVMDQAGIDEIAKNFKNSMSDAFTKAGLPDYYEDEITFDPSLFVFTVDASTGELSLTSEYGPVYTKYQDEYMATIGVTPGWRDRPKKLDTIINITLIILLVLIIVLSITGSPWALVTLPVIPLIWYLHYNHHVFSSPTDSQLQDSEDYAMSKLCTEIPSKYGSGLTQWDPKSKSCKITDKGCTPDVTNPISRIMYTSSGEPLSFDQNDRNFGPFWKYWNPDMYVKKVTSKSPNTPVCSRGNSLLYQWCKYPQKRSDKSIPGLTNQVPFDYSIKNGSETCEVTPDYCKAHGVNYKDQTCYVTKGQQIGEFFASEVLVRRLKVSDQRLKTNIKFIKNVTSGVDIYSFVWTKEAERLYGNKGLDIGFIADKLDKKYITIDSNGYKNINTDIRDKNMNMIRSFLALKQHFLKY